MDLALGVNWLELVNLAIDWSGGKVYLPHAVHTALLQGDWLASHVKAGAVTVLVNQEELERLNHEEVKNRIAVLKSPKFWNIKTKQANSRANFFEGDVQWGFLYSNECKICNFENPCNSECKHHKIL